jgi:uncharacterized protein YlxP (DUF503 family)
MMHAGTLTMDLRIRGTGSLKAKRTVVKDQWQRSEVGFAAVANTPGHVEDVLDAVERYVWSHPELEVLAEGRSWVEPDA